jgi:hypothetical protein
MAAALVLDDVAGWSVAVRTYTNEGTSNLEARLSRLLSCPVDSPDDADEIPAPHSKQQFGSR